MNIKLIRTLWGMQGFESVQTLRQSLQSLKDKGYNGIEVAITFTQHREEMVKICQELNMDIITQIHTCSYPQSHTSVEKHLESFQEEIQKALQWNPVLINSHSGRDAWNESQNIEFFTKAKKIESEQLNNIQLCHETHRQRSFYNPYITNETLKRIPDLNINLDLSHWNVVSERNLDINLDPEWKEMQQIIQERAIQIHARVGSAQNIQVNDPSCKEHTQDVDWYLNVWNQIVQRQSDLQNLQNFYITCEFGPHPYQPVALGTMNPLGNLEETNDWMQKVLKNNFKQFIQ